MAIAGKVAITPKGDWNADTTYEKLDLVFYDNASYVATKPSTGVIPTDESHWMLVVQSAGGADFEGIIDGDIQVGNAKTLDGHKAEYFAPLERIIPQRVVIGTDLNACIKTGVYFFDGVATNYVNVPSASAHNGILIVNSFNEDVTNSERIVQMYFSGNQNVLYLRTSLGSVDDWKQWKTVATTADLAAELAKYLPLTGGTLTDSLFVKRTDNASILVVTENALNKLISGVNGSGVAYMQDKNGNVIVCNTDGTRTFNGTASGNLKNDGNGVLNPVGGSYGGRVTFGKPNTTNLSGPIVMDISTNSLRIAESGGTYRGVTLDFTETEGSNASKLLHTGNGATYEEGTFDLTLEGRTLSGYKYTKIGNFVYLSGLVPFNGEPLTIENTTVEVHGLPFGISSVPPYLYFGTAVYSPSNKATDNLVNYVPGGTYFGIGGSGSISFANGAPCILHAMYITD